MLEQDSIAGALRREFPGVPVESEWRARLPNRDLFYSPRIDIAVGPFAMVGHLGDAYDRLVLDHRPFLCSLHDQFSRNVHEFTFSDPAPPLDHLCGRNWSARCFLAIELENSGSRKHVMGGAINAAALGRVGISVAGSAERLRVLLRMRSYLLYLSSGGKNTFDTSNLLVVTAEQLLDSIGGREQAAPANLRLERTQ